MRHFISSVVLASAFASSSFADVHVEVRGSVTANSHIAGHLATAIPGDPVIVSFDVFTPGIVVSPGSFSLYNINPASFDVDVNGSVGLTLPSSPVSRMKMFNDFNGMDAFEVQTPLLSSGYKLDCLLDAATTLWSSDDPIAHLGTNDLAAQITGGDFFGLFVGGNPNGWINFTFDSVTFINLGVPQYPSFCSGDGGDQIGCTNCPCTNNGTPGTVGGCLNSAGTSASLFASGDNSVSLPPSFTSDLRFGLTGAPPSAFCILNSGDAVAPGNMANPCFGMNSGAQAAAFDGLRCAITNTRRHGGRSADANGDVGVTGQPWGGEGGPPVGIAQAGAGFLAGQTRYFQVINRDDALVVCMRGLNTSQAVEVTFAP